MTSVTTLSPAAAVTTLAPAKRDAKAVAEAQARAIESGPRRGKALWKKLVEDQSDWIISNGLDEEGYIKHYTAKGYAPARACEILDADYAALARYHQQLSRSF